MLGDSQWPHVDALVDALDGEQLSWLSGFLAGVAHGRGLAGRQAQAAAAVAAAATPQPVLDVNAGAASSVVADATDPVQAPAASPPSTPVARPRRRLVLYGSETGNAASIARELAQRLHARGPEHGQTVTLADMADFRTRQLREFDELLVVASTHGEGEPPEPALSFFEFLNGRKAPRLDGMRHAVLALGDTTYEQFCAAGRQLDERLSALGSTALLVRVDCDVDYEETAEGWISTLLDRLAADIAPAVEPLPSADIAPSSPPDASSLPSSSPAAASAFAAAANDTGHDRRKPFPARVIDNIVLTGRGSSKEVRHLELSLEGSGLSYEPGDALGLRPRNDGALVENLLDGLGLSGDTAIVLKDRSLPLREALAGELDIVNVTPRFLESWARYAAAPSLAELAPPERATERTAFARAHHIVDVVRRFPVTGLAAGEFVKALRPLQPRLYSIASSAAAVPDEVHLTISTLRYELLGQPRLGVASGYLGGCGPLPDALPVYVQSSPHFRLPADDVPIIMIGAGTGVAPFRAFLQEREARSAPGRAWLFFGERRSRTDFLYQTEWQAWLQDGLLDRMEVAFSRDAIGGTSKTYVQHRLLEHGAEVHDWLQDGAHVYVCGDAAQMAPDVHRALAGILMTHGGHDADGARDHLRQLQETHRYQRDVY